MPRRKGLQLSPKKIPRQARSRRTVDDILETAARLLVRSGYEALTTNHVADAAGIGVASVYEYFPNKQAIVAAVITKIAGDVLEELRDALAEALRESAHGGGPKVVLEAWLRAMFDAMERRKVIVAVLVREVPFLWDVPAVRELGDRLLELARSAGALAQKPFIVEHYEAVVYLMTVMVRAAVLESVIRPPAHVAQDELRTTLSQLLTELLLA